LGPKTQETNNDAKWLLFTTFKSYCLSPPGISEQLHRTTMMQTNNTLGPKKK
jgi:hypothetical protein